MAVSFLGSIFDADGLSVGDSVPLGVDVPASTPTHPVYIAAVVMAEGVMPRVRFSGVRRSRCYPLSYHDPYPSGGDFDGWTFLAGAEYTGGGSLTPPSILARGFANFVTMTPSTSVEVYTTGGSPVAGSVRVVLLRFDGTTGQAASGGVPAAGTFGGWNWNGYGHKIATPTTLHALAGYTIMCGAGPLERIGALGYEDNCADHIGDSCDACSAAGFDCGGCAFQIGLQFCCQEFEHATGPVCDHLPAADDGVPVPILCGSLWDPYPSAEDAALTGSEGETTKTYGSGTEIQRVSFSVDAVTGGASYNPASPLRYTPCGRKCCGLVVPGGGWSAPIHLAYNSNPGDWSNGWGALCAQLPVDCSHVARKYDVMARVPLGDGTGTDPVDVGVRASPEYHADNVRIRLTDDAPVLP